MTAKICAWWCEDDPRNTGWYAEEKDEQGHVISDSVKVWFPLDLDVFGRNEDQALIEALSVVFPNHAIYVE